MKAVNVSNLLICQIESTTTIRDIELITASPENSPDMLAVEAEFMLNCLLSVN